MHCNPDVRIVHRGKSKRLSAQERKLLERRQAIEPIILNPAVGRARAGRHRARGQGANHSHGARHGEDLQRRPRARGRLERVRSAHQNGERLLHQKRLRHQQLALS
jgi:hypothetical protein